MMKKKKTWMRKRRSISWRIESRCSGMMIQKSNINKKSKEEEVKEVKKVKVKEDSIKEPDAETRQQQKPPVSLAMDQEEVKEEVKEEQLKEEEEVNKEEDKNEVLFDDALATEIKLTTEKPIQFKRQKTPSPVKQIIITKAVQSSDPQTHLQVLEKYGGGNGINNIIKNNFQEEEHRTLASTLWLLKKIASNRNTDEGFRENDRTLRRPCLRRL